MAENVVTSVNGQTGKVKLTSSDFGLQQETWTFTNLDGTVEEQQVVINKAVILISFTIEGTPYQAEEDMTWEQWCNSKYNINSYYCAGLVYVLDNGIEYAVMDTAVVIGHNLIESKAYQLFDVSDGEIPF